MILRFQNPDLLWGFLPLFAFAVYLLIRRVKSKIPFSWRRFALSISTMTFCLLGLARPQGGTQVTSQVGMRSNLFIAIDISRSMMAQDVSPSRIQLGVTLAQELLKHLGGTKVALFPFALDGYVQMPLSADLMAASDLLSAINPSITTQQGTDLTLALNTLFDRIVQTEQLTRDRGGDWSSPQVLLLSDGESHYELNKSVLQKYRAKHIPIFAVTLGTEQGMQIPISTDNDARSFYRAPAAKSVLTKANPKTMKQIAIETNGDYFSGRFESLPAIEQRMKRAMEMGKLTTTFRIDREFFPYFFLIAFLLFLWDFSMLRWEFAIRSLILFLFFGAATKAHAQSGVEAEQLATKSYNQAVEQLGKNDFAGAAENFQQSVYMSQNKALQKKALFNMGNAYLKSGDPTQALQAYQQAFDTLTGEPEFDKETNQKISDNIVLAAKIEQQMKESEQKKKGKGGDDGDSKSKSGEGSDPKGPKKFQAQPMNEGQKQKIYDLISAEERQGIQRVQEMRNRNSATTTDKPW